MILKSAIINDDAMREGMRTDSVPAAIVVKRQSRPSLRMDSKSKGADS
jgi:hypothetical protein